MDTKQKQILEINSNPNLTNQEKQSKINDIIMGKYLNNQFILTQCDHYKKKCTEFYFLCCNKTYDCCRCHNLDQNIKCNSKPIVNTIKCINCGTTQNPSDSCTNCLIKFSRNYCDICSIWSEKNIFHCESCGICRIGEKNKYLHCNNCQACFKSPHHCINNLSDTKLNFSTTTQCLLCLENATTSQYKLTYLPKCKHPVHSECLTKSSKSGNYKCPLCRKSMFDMNNYWKLLETEINMQILPNEIKKNINILCNDCEIKSENAEWHFLGTMCKICHGFNTVEI